jgi:hypothetical protein
VIRRLAALALVAACACSSEPTELASSEVLEVPLTTPSPTPTPTPTVAPPVVTKAPTPVPAPATVAPKPPAAPAPKPAGDRSAAFRGLGSWIDVFDHNEDPASLLPHIRAMAAKGTKTLYIETARYASETDIQFPAAIGAALDEAKALKMRVVAWYPPAFGDVGRDVRRSLAAVKFRSPKGNRFDAFAADIEYKAEVPDHAERTRRAVDYSKRLRAAAPGYPLAAITIAPTSLELVAERWPGFPWEAIGTYFDVVMPMNYWTGRGRDAATAATLTEQNATKARTLAGLPVHVIGGLGADADEQQVKAYVSAARKSGSLGGGLYDFRTTRAEVWDELRALNG